MPSNPAAMPRVIPFDARIARQACHTAALHNIRYANKPIAPVSAATFN